ncbi:hypothetical protein [Enterococcus avium]|nr:hypothetical protein [Enterococcus avium]MDU3947119.1 hypothetical protein [Enterococcus avium]
MLSFYGLDVKRSAVYFQRFSNQRSAKIEGELASSSLFSEVP